VVGIWTVAGGGAVQLWGKELKVMTHLAQQHPKQVRIAAAAVLTSGAMLFAGPPGLALADPPGGSYTGTIIDGAGVKQNGSTSPVTLTPCGPDCTRIDMGSSSQELHLQGNAYIGRWVEERVGCSGSLDGGSLVYSYSCGGVTLVIGLTKNG
jgi:hypothetical protein